MLELLHNFPQMTYILFWEEELSDNMNQFQEHTYFRLFTLVSENGSRIGITP